MIEEGGKAVSGVIAGLSSNPLVLALITINLIFLVGGGWIARDTSIRVHEANHLRDLREQEDKARRDKMLTEIMDRCYQKKDGG
jgi:hypothetical protein